MLQGLLERMFHMNHNEGDNRVVNETNKQDVSAELPKEAFVTEQVCGDNYGTHVDNSLSVVLKIAMLYADKLMSDICLIVDGVQYPAHRLILCASSDVFQVMLMKPEWAECKERTVNLQEDPQCAAVFSHFLRYLYTGILNITYSNALPLLTLADKYNVKDLVTLCTNYMLENVVYAANKGQLVIWLQYAITCGRTVIAQACLDFIKWNFEMLAEHDDYGMFDTDTLSSILQQNDLVVSSEIELYRLVVKWLDIQQARLQETGLTVEERILAYDSMVMNTMNQIRFPMMTPRELAELLLKPLTKRYKEFFVDRMAIGMSYHSGQMDRVREVFAKSNEEGRMIFTPRLYTSDVWGASMTLENYPTIPQFHIATMMFSSQATLAEYNGEQLSEWVVDFYPKGVWFKKSQLIGMWHASMEIPEIIMKTVRVAVTCNSPPPQPMDIRVRVGVIVTGTRANIEHNIIVKERVYHFSHQNRILNFDDVIAFDALNGSSSPNIKNYTNNPFLIGVNRDQFRIQVIIAPLDTVCCLECPKIIFK